MSDKPLFIPLKRQFFEAFKNGTKDTEYRRHGALWNAQTCRIGRAVVLSLGYGKAHRLYGVVEAFTCDKDPAKIPGWGECYVDELCVAACIKIKLNAHDSRN